MNTVRYWQAVFAFLLLAACVMAACSQRLKIQFYTEHSTKVSGRVRMAVIADLHDSLYGKGQKELIGAIRRQEPDLVLLAGDIADDKESHEGTRLLLSAIGQEYPCYYVTGNHEYWSGEVEAIKEMIASYGVTVLEGECVTLDVHGQEVKICGVDDKAGFTEDFFGRGIEEGGWARQLANCREQLIEGQYAVLLSHRPELTEAYAASGFDLVAAGHAHGGQVRIPGFLNGLFAPGQGFFPPYAGGRYELGGTILIVSRGLCKNILPRVFNRPELVMIDVLPDTLCVSREEPNLYGVRKCGSL